MTNTCPVCGRKIGLFNREKSADGLICAECNNFFFSKLGFRTAKQPTDTLAAYWTTLEQRRKAFRETDSIYDGDSLFVSIDETNQLFFFGHRSGDKGSRMIYSFEEVAGYESDADDVMITQSVGGIGRAVVGAAIAGPVGAIVGASTAKTETRKGRSKENVSIRFTLPLGEQVLATQKFPSGMTAFLNKCISRSGRTANVKSTTESVADELLKFKKLLDLGAITEEEYNAKKSQLLKL